MQNNVCKTVVTVLALLALSACATTKTGDPDQDIDTANSEVQTEAPSGESKGYEPLVYGAPKPLVCGQEYPAEGKFAKRPNLQVMWENYLYDRPEGIWSEIGGYVEKNGTLPLDKGRWTNACSVRLSHMLNKADHKIPRQRNNTSVSGGNKDQYIYRVADMEKYLLSTFGAPDLAITDGSGGTWDIPPKPGVLLMDFKVPGNSFSGHVTVWNGAGSVDNADIGGQRILFWEMPCFIPLGRTSTEPVADAGTILTVSP